MAILNKMEGLEKITVNLAQLRTEIARLMKEGHTEISVVDLLLIAKTIRKESLL